ncbi:MAG: taurine catabolism dioxygenase TauD [Gemmatimonadetes bacterium]|nr:taurine catabolism dioxygenase TauD [Gemmatimonadota bacterium]|tara:strand:- start:2576 stop:3535 length:960 start_codon:yes stop_codon:yes gene_type:complete
MQLTEHINLPRGWTSETAGDSDAWVHRLPYELLEAYAQDEGDELDASPNLIHKWRPAFESMIGELDGGHGFILIDRVPIETLSIHAARRVYWRIGQSLGRPIEQNIQGTLLYDVKDTGADVAEGARFSVTNAESSFHTDAAFADTPPEYVGLLCLAAAQRGGESQLVSAYALHNALRAEGTSLEAAYEPFHFDRRGQFRPGEPNVMTAPIFRWDGRELDTRYLDYYIRVGHQVSDSPLTDDQCGLLERIESTLSAGNLHVAFSLQPGQMLFTNNHWILHNRTAFEDHPDPDRRRHYIRLWLSRNSSDWAERPTRIPYET